MSALNKNTITILVTAVLFTCFMGLIVVHVAIVTSPHSDACLKLAQQFNELTLPDCVWYVDENPSATGQDIVDHFKPTTKPSLEELLANPVAP